MSAPLAVWVFPHVERRKRLCAFAFGVVLGSASAGLFFVLFN